MRKHFLILMLFALLPFAGWAQTSIADYEVLIGGTGGFVYNGNDQSSDITLIVRKSDAESPLVDPSSTTDEADYDLKFYKADGTPTNVVKDAGNYSVSAVGKGNYKDETRKISFTVAKASIKYTLKENETDDQSTQDVDESSFNINFTATYKKENFGDQKFTIKNVKLVAAAPGGESVEDLFNVSANAKWSYTGTNANFNSEGTTSLSEGDKGYKVSLSGITTKSTVNTNYDVTYEPNYVKIKQAVIDLATENSGFTVTSAYDEANPKVPFIYNGLKQYPEYTIKYQYGEGENDFETLTQGVNFDVTYKKADAAATPIDADEIKNYFAYAAAKANTNFDVSSTENNTKLGDFQIKKRALTISVKPDSKIYDGVALTADDLDQTKIRYTNLAEADVVAGAFNFKNANDEAEVTLDFADASADKTNAGDIALVVKCAANPTTAIKNYNVKWVDDEGHPAITGKYTIKRRPVTVQLQDIHFERGDDKLSSAATGDQNINVEDKNGDEDTDYNVIIEKATEGSNSGVIVTTAATEQQPAVYDNLASDLVITLKQNANAYPTVGSYPNKITLDFKYYSTIGKNYIVNGVEIPAITQSTTANSKIEVAKSKVIVDAETLKVYVDMLRKEYGYELNSADFECYAINKNGDEVELTGTPTFIIYDDDKTVSDGAVLGVGSYVAKIDPASLKNLSAANYTITEENVFGSALVISKKKVTFTINPLTLNPGTTTAKLNEYASVDEKYKNQLVGADKETGLTFTFAFNPDAIKTGTTNETLYSQFAIDTQNNNAVTGLKDDADAGDYAEGIIAEVIAYDEANEENGWIAANNNYEVTFVKGALKIVEGGVLYLTQTDEYLDDKIKAAAEACAVAPAQGEQPTTYTVVFGSRELKAGNWYTMVLPFDIRTADLVAALQGPDEVAEGEAQTYHSVYAVTNRFSKASTADHISFTLEMNKIPANEPFMIKVGEDIDLKNVDFKGAKMTIKYVATPKITDADGSNAGNEFVGVYTATPIQANQTTSFFPAWYDSENTKADPKGAQWRVPGSAAETVKPMEAYLVYSPSKDWSNKAPIITFEDLNENGTTSIVTFNADTKSYVAVDGWYTLNGVKLQGVPTEKGIYINNGKKIVIK